MDDAGSLGSDESSKQYMDNILASDILNYISNTIIYIYKYIGLGGLDGIV